MYKKSIIFSLAILAATLPISYYYRPKRYVRSNQPIPEFFTNYINNNKLVDKGYYQKYLFLNKYQPHYFQSNLNRVYQHFQVFHQELKNYSAEGQHEVAVLYKPGIQLQAHKFITHGGSSATLIDNFYGIVAGLSTNLSPSVTAKLQIDFKKPVKIGKYHLMVVKTKKIQGKKIFVQGQIINQNDQKCVVSKGLMIKIEQGGQAWNVLSKLLKDQIQK